MNYNEKADREQYERYKDVLGADAPATFSDFQELKYSGATEYDELKGFYSYRGRVPEATKADYATYKSIVATGVSGTVRVPPRHVDFDSLQFKDEHGKHHGCSLKDARGYIKSAKCSITRKRWDGYHTNYYALDGATYVSDDDGVINTAFSEEDFDDITQKILEVFK